MICYVLLLTILNTQEEFKESPYLSANTLSKGTTRIGIFSSFDYGVLEDLTIGSHPILDLLITPNINGKLRLYSISNLALSITIHYGQSFFKKEENQYPGVIRFGAIASMVVKKIEFSLQSGFGYLFFNQEEHLIESLHMVCYLKNQQFIGVSVAFRIPLSPLTFDPPTMAISYARQIYSFWILAGIKSTSDYEFQNPILNKTTKLSVYPVFDLFWYF